MASRLAKNMKRENQPTRLSKRMWAMSDGHSKHQEINVVTSWMLPLCPTFPLECLLLPWCMEEDDESWSLSLFASTQPLDHTPHIARCYIVFASPSIEPNERGNHPTLPQSNRKSLSPNKGISKTLIAYIHKTQSMQILFSWCSTILFQHLDNTLAVAASSPHQFD